MKTRKTPSKFLLHLIIGSALVFILGSASPCRAEVRIAIIDSGARGYVDAAFSFTSYTGDEDPLNHGTEIARLIRQKNPSATIYMLQVCEKVDGSFKPSRDAILRAIQWVIANNIDVVNMSLVTKYSSNIDEAVTDAAVNHGIVFVAAAGNRGLNNHFAVDSDGFVRRSKGKSAPAFPSSNPYVISVGGLDSSGQIAHYSDKSADLYADGKILGQEGSSFASARIAGQIAGILQGQPRLPKDVLLSYLR